MIALPWEIGQEALAYIDELPAEQRLDGLITYQHFTHNSYKVPCYSSFVIYGLFLLLILTASANNLVAWAWPGAHDRCRKKLRLFRAHISEHPLIARKHSVVASVPALRWLTLQLPLRGEAIILLCLSLANFLPLVAFYDLYIGDKNIFYPGPTSKRDQMYRHLADRTAVLGTAQLPLLILMASKRTPLAIVASLGMNKLMLFHRWISRWVWIQILLHTAAFTAIYVQSEGAAGVALLLEDTYVKWGVVSLSMMFGLVFLSLRFLRQWSYEIFVMLHILMAFFAVLGAYLHIALIQASSYQLFVVMTEIAAGIWAFDRVVRFASRLFLSFASSSSEASGAKKFPSIKCATAVVSSLDATSSKYTRLRISLPASRLRLPGRSRLPGGIAAGDDIRITIPRLQWVGEHPFTVFAVGVQPESPAQGFVDLLVKTEAGITRKMSRLVDSRANTEMLDKDMEVASTGETGREVAVLVEGPFGIIPDVSEASHLVLVAGGIAITFCWPLFVAAVKASKSSKLKSCKLVWLVRDEGLLNFVSESFKELVEEMDGSDDWRSCSFSIDLHVTASTSSLSTVVQEMPRSEGVNTLAHLSSSTSLSSNEDKEQAGSSDGASHKGSTPSSEIVNGIDDQPEGEKQRHVENGHSSRAHEDTIKIKRALGRPPVLSTALFGHLDSDELRAEGGLVVGLCGPPSLCDDVRVETVDMLKKGYHVDLVEDCFTW